LPAVPGPTTPILRALLALPVAAALLIAGCGGSGDETSSGGDAPAPAASEFPDPAGKSLADLARSESQSDLVVAPTGSVFDVGKDRYGFGVFKVAGDPVQDSQVAIYAAPSGSNSKDDVIGPFPASSSSLVTPPAFASRTTTQDPDAAKNVYTAEVQFPKAGKWDILAIFRESDGSYSYTAVHTANVGADDKIPDVGDKAPVIHTPTADDVGGDLTKIDTRDPADTMHETDLADVIGKEPVVLLFATPALCTSRVCGPVVDIAEEVKEERPDDAAYIHMEIYNDNDPNKGARQQVLDYGLKSEPWLFVLDSDGKVSTRIEGAFSKQELEAAIDKAS
jgi:hypothetical protein